MSFNPYIKLIELAWDAYKVHEAAKRARVSALRAGGALVRRLARALLKRRRASAKPNDPPFSHEGDLKALLFFAYDEGTESEVIGPIRKSSSKGAGTIPNLLEFGGTRTQTFRSGHSRTIEYHKFPYMQPALDQASPQLPSHWKNSVRAD